LKTRIFMKTVIFDFDGTLVDTIRELILIYNGIADSYGVDKVGENQMQRLQHKTGPEIFEELHIPPAKVPAIGAKIKALLKAKIGEMRLVDGIAEVLSWIKAHGYRLCIISSNRTDSIKIFLEKNKIDFINFVFTGNDFFGKHLVINKFISRYGIATEDVIYVGDEVRDIDACRKLGIKIISVCWGFNSREALSKRNGRFIAEDANDIIKFLQ
jgi:phosphoglycolate phosphatase